MAATLPHLTAMVTAESHDVADPVLGWCDGQTEFEFTLALILDGLERGAAAQDLLPVDHRPSTQAGANRAPSVGSSNRPR
ncbi:hypothetical protein JCM9534A_20390 [Catenuloplanes indicus JCM 9534]